MMMAFVARLPGIKAPMRGEGTVEVRKVIHFFESLLEDSVICSDAERHDFPTSLDRANRRLPRLIARFARPLDSSRERPATAAARVAMRGAMS
jgi:hypothetical protein